MIRRISIGGVLVVVALAALAATSPTIVRRMSGDLFIEGQVYGSQDLHFDGTNSVKEAITNHTHHADRIVAGILAPERLGSNSPTALRFLRGDSQWVELPDDTDADTLGGQVGSWYLARSNHTGTQVLASISDAGTAAARNVPASGDAGAAEVVLGNDTRLSDSRTPTSHVHAGGDITSGTVGTARLGSGTANSTTFLRGDGSWAGIPDDTAADTLGGQVGSWYLARSNHTGTQAHTTITGLGGLAVVNDPVSDGKVYGRSLGGWAEVVAAEVGTNNPVHGNLLIKKDLPTVFFSDDASDTGGGIVFGVGGFVVGPANYGNPDYVGTPWVEISTNGAVTIADDLVSGGDGEFVGSVSGTEYFGNRITLSTASNTNAPATGKAAIFLRQVGGKGQLVVRFPTGADQVIATEP